MTTKEKVIKEYKKVYQAHPSYRDIAKKVGCSKTLVAYYIKGHLSDNRSS